MLNTSSRWPIYLAIAGMVIVAASVWYTQRLADKISISENGMVDLYRNTVERVNNLEINDTGDEDFSTEGEILAQVQYLPRILVNDITGDFNGASGFGTRNDDTAYVMAQLEKWIEAGVTPVKQPDQLQYIGESRLIQQIRYFPIFQFFLIGAFIFLGYIGINQARKAEQNRVWVGMAKET
ncbi:MAG: two-component sensor histidine kinase, partial [Bacteroidota bacterium]